MKDKILSKILEIIREEGAPTVNVGSGNIAGTKEAGDDPPVRKKKKIISHWESEAQEMDDQVSTVLEERLENFETLVNRLDSAIEKIAE